MWDVFSLLVTLIVAIYTLKPFLRGTEQELFDPLANKNLLQDKNERLSQLKEDLEHDYATKKIAEEDYQKMRVELKEEQSSLKEDES